MLYAPEETLQILRRFVKEVSAGDPIEVSRRMLAILPGYGPAYLLIGTTLLAEGKLDEAEAVLWEGLLHEPCRAPMYLNLAQVRTDRNQGDVLAKRLRHLALWKLSFEDEIAEPLVEVFEKLLGDEAREPETYEQLARYEDIQVGKAQDPPEVVERLRPYRLLNDLQREAPDDLSEETLQQILAHAAACEPVLRGALRHWAREAEALDDFTVSLLIAILGEISGPDAVDELLELASTGNTLVFPHVHWALHNLGMRFPREVLERFRVAARSASVNLRCALADQIDLLEDTKGDIEVLVSLLDDFETLAREGDATYLLAEVVHALVERDDVVRAKSLAAKYESKIPKKDRPLLREALKAVGDYTPVLVEKEIDSPDIEGVCLERYFLPDEDEEDDEDLEEEDDFDDPVDLEPPPPKPGRNDPCWCGSGKKYKKCHLAADQEAERAQAASEEDDDPDEPANTLHAHLMQDVFKVSREWHTNKDLERAKLLYFGTADKVEATQDDINLFVEWVLHDFRDSRTGQTAIENYLRTRGPKLTRLEREHLESLRDARFGLFEVERIEPGSGVHLHDLSADDRMFVHDVSMSNGVARWATILARVQFESGRWVFAGNGTEIPRKLLDRFLEMVDAESGAAGQTRAEFIRANSHRLHREAKETGEEWIAGLTIVNNEGEELAFGKAEYQVHDGTALLATLRTIEELREEPPGDPGVHTFAWLQPMGDSVRPLGNVTVGPGFLTLEAPSRTRLQTGRGLLESHAGGFLRHFGDSFTSIDEVKQAAMSGNATPVEPSSPIPPEVEREVVLKFKTEHYAQWVNDPLPALKGKTPRQAIKTPEGRKAVIALLRDFEHMEGRELRSGRPSYDVNIIRRELGLTEE